MYHGRAIFTEKFHVFVGRVASIGLGIMAGLSIIAAVVVVIGG